MRESFDNMKIWLRMMKEEAKGQVKLIDRIFI